MVWLAALFVAAMYYRSVTVQRDAVKRIQLAGGRILYSYEYSQDSANPFEKRPAPLAELLGPDWFYSVIYVDFSLQSHSGGELECLIALPELKSIEFNLTSFPNDGLAPIRSIRSLEELLFAESGITDSDLVHLSSLYKLQTLRLLECPGITSSGLTSLRGLGNLRHLQLTSTAIDDEGLSHLSNLSGLVSLSLADTRITDAGLIHIAHLDSIESLELGETQITDEGIKALVGMRRLQTLWVESTEITDESVDTLKNFPLLKDISVRDTKMTSRGVRQLRSLPRLSVSY